MELTQVMETRRSMRGYDPARPVDQADIRKMIEAAALAPSWKNSQTARYYVAESPEMTERIRETCLPEFNRKNSAGAPVLIVTSFAASCSGFDRDGNPDNELGNGWGCYDLGLHNAYLILKAKELGLDTLIMGIRDEQGLRELLHIPEKEIIVSVIAVGYGTLNPQMPPRKSVDEIAKFY